MSSKSEPLAPPPPPRKAQNGIDRPRTAPPISLTELAHQPFTARELTLLVPALLISLIFNLALVVALLIYNSANAGHEGEDKNPTKNGNQTGLASKDMIDVEGKGDGSDPKAKPAESPIEVPGIPLEKPMVETPPTPEKKKDTGSGGKQEEGFVGTGEKSGALPGTFIEKTKPGMTGKDGFGPTGQGSGLGGKGGGKMEAGGFGDRTGNLLDKARSRGGNDESERAVVRGLQWLANHQGPDGRWTLDRYHEHGHCNCRDFSVERANVIEQNDAAATALALLPFLGAGQTHQNGSFAENIKGGILSLTSKQEANGNLGGREHNGLYAHGLATIALCEAYALSKDPKIRVAAQRAINFTIYAQNPKTSGWYYTPRSTEDSDLSVSAWQIMALRSGQLAGLAVPGEAINKSPRRLNAHAYQKDARYSYRRGTRSGPPAMTAAGLLCRQYLGWQRDTPALKRGCDVLLEMLPPEAPRNDAAEEKVGPIYYYYYASQVMHHMEGSYWERWNPRMRDFLIRTQEKTGHRVGSWNPEETDWGRAGGRIYVTSLSILTLEVYYRHLPLYRRGNEATPQEVMKPQDKPMIDEDAVNQP